MLWLFVEWRSDEIGLINEAALLNTMAIGK